MFNIITKQFNIKSSLINLIYILNISLPMLFFAFFFISKKYDESVEYMIVVSLSLFLTFSLSGNYRQTLVADNNIELCENILARRIFLSSIIFILSCLISIFILKISDFGIIFVGAFISIIIWLNEINIAILQIKRDYKNLFFKFFFNYILLLIIFISFFFLKNNYLKVLIILYVLIFFLQNFDFKVLKKINQNNKIKLKLARNYISSLSLNFSSFLFKYEINFFVDKKNAALLFFCITLGSSLNTIVFNSMGPKDFNNSIKLSFQFLFLLIIYFLACLVIFVLIDMGLIFENLLEFTKQTLITSAFGGFIFTYSYIFRQNIISKKQFRDKGFALDILYSFIVVLLVPILFYINADYIFLSYAIACIFSFVIYFYYYNFIVRKQI